MIVGIPMETFPGERRVSLIPETVPQLAKAGMEVLLETGAGVSAGFPDSAYEAKGAKIARNRDELFSGANIIALVRWAGADPNGYRADLSRLNAEKTIVGFMDPLGEQEAIQEAAKTGASLFALELIPRTTRAQSMDVLSSMATVSGYKAALLAAEKLPRMFPMLMTAAGVIHPARVFVVGAGVAGLQAIATAKRLGAVVQGYDIRDAAKEEIESLGAKSVDLPLDVSDAEDTGGYAKAMDESFYRKQAEVMARVVAESDVVITTAVIPGKQAPVLITREMVANMSPGSVIVDMAAERGGNCELTKPGEEVRVQGVTILGPCNLAATIPNHASQMYAKNISIFLLHLVKEGQLKIDLEDDITQGTLVGQGGQVVHRKLLKEGAS